jgi:hypothetical protein
LIAITVRVGLIVKQENHAADKKAKREKVILHADPLRLCVLDLKEKRRAVNELNGYLKNNTIIKL